MRFEGVSRVGASHQPFAVRFNPLGLPETKWDALKMGRIENGAH